MTVSEDLARRFLHVNLNCESLDATEGLYVKQLGLSARMRTDARVAGDGAVLGFDTETYGATSFLYDAPPQCLSHKFGTQRPTMLQPGAVQMGGQDHPARAHGFEFGAAPPPQRGSTT